MQTTQSRHRRNGGVGSTLALLLLGVLLLTGVAMYCYTHLLPHIESDLTERVTAELVDNGITTALVSVDGTDVTLSGLVSPDSSALEAEQLALAVHGVTRVQNNLNKNTGDGSTTNSNTNIEDNDNKTTGNTSDNASDNTTGNTTANAVNGIAAEDVSNDVNANDNANIAGDDQTNTATQTTLKADNDTQALTASPSLEIIVRDDAVTIGGVLPDTSMSQRIAAAVAVKYGHDNVENRITIIPETPDPTWLDGTISIIDRIDKITNPKLNISADEAKISGTVSSETLGAQQLSAAKRALGNELTVSATFSVTQRTSDLQFQEQTKRQTRKRPASLRVDSNNNQFRLMGTVSSSEEADTIRETLGELIEDSDYTDELVIDDSVASADWINEALAVTESVKDIDNFSVSINSGQMMLSGDVTNRDRGKALTDTAKKLANGKLNVVNNYSINRAELVIDSAEDERARELSQKLLAIDTSKIVFQPGSTELAAEARKILDTVAETIAGYPDQIVEISGHTDSSGDSVVNLELSKERAVAVRDYLVSNGLPSNQLRPIGYGESNPVADNSTSAGRAANRRIEFNL